MDWELLLTAGAVIGGLVRYILGTRGRRNRIKSDLDILEKMPDGEAADLLRAHINDEVAALVRDASQKRRDWFGVGLGLTFLALGIWFAANGIEGSNIWFLPASVLLIFGLVGTFESGALKERDERGRAIKESNG